MDHAHIETGIEALRRPAQRHDNADD
jgi:hypothetical protein